MDRINRTCLSSVVFVDVVDYIVRTVAQQTRIHDHLKELIAKLVRPSKPGGEKGVAYECGELPVGSSWVRFNIRFYLVALFFIVFDVEVLFLYPWATVFKDLFPVAGSLVFVEMAVFIAILVIGLAYVWAKGDLDWVKTLASRNGTEVSGE